MDSDSSSHSNSELISELANDYLDRCRQGERPPLSEYIERHPELEQGIRDILPMLLIIEENAADQTSAQRLHSMQPEKLGDFVIGRELGRGGMGIVYEAVQESLGRHVALKVCSLTPGMSSSNRERFRRESRSAALLQHTNIVPVFAVGEEDGLLYYAMQHIRGATLEDVIQELRLVWKDSARATARLTSLNRSVDRSEAVSLAKSVVSGDAPLLRSRRDATNKAKEPTQTDSAADPTGEAVDVSLPGQSANGDSGSGAKTRYWESVARIGIQVANALTYAHAQGILHRDIKPGNLMLDQAGIIWVMDFGLAKSTVEDDLTKAGELIGTLRYMAPEQAIGRSDARSDIYSLGLTLYELLALRPAFQEIHRIELLRAIAETEPIPPRRINPRVPRDLETIALKAIEKDPNKRYASAQEFEKDLNRFLSGEPIHARRVNGLEWTIKWAKRRPLVVALLSALAILFCVSFALVSWKWIEAERANAVAWDREELAKQRLEESQDHIYRTGIARAELTSTTDPVTANRLLTELEPEPGRIDRRGWEWGYLRALVNQHAAVFQLGSTDAPWVWGLAFSHDASMLAVGTGRARFVQPVAVSPPGSVTVWRTRTAKRICELPTEHSAYDLAFSRDSQKLVVSEVLASEANEDDWVTQRARVWDLPTMQPVVDLELPTASAGRLTDLHFAADDRYIIGEEWNSKGDVQFSMWDAETGEHLHSIPKTQLEQVAQDGWSVDLHGPRAPDGELGLFQMDLETKQRLNYSVAPYVYTGVLSRDRRWLADLGEQQRLALRDLQTDTVVYITGDDEFRATSRDIHRPVCAFHPTENHFFVGATDGTIRIYQTQTKNLVGILRGHVAPIQALTVSNDGRWLASGDWNGEVRLWKPEQKAHVVGVWPDVSVGVTRLECVAFRWDGAGVVVYETGGLKTYDSESGARLQVHHKVNHSVVTTRDADFDAAGERLVIGHSSKTAEVVQVSSGATLCFAPVQAATVHEVNISGDGQRIAFSTGSTATAGSDAGIHVFQVNSTGGEAETVWTSSVAAAHVTVLALDHSGNRLAVAGYQAARSPHALSRLENFRKIYNLADNTEIDLQDSGTVEVVKALKFSPDGHRLAAGSVEGHLMLFNAVDGSLQNENQLASHNIWQLAWHPGGTRLASVDRAKVILWNASAEFVMSLRGDPRYDDQPYDPSVAFSPDGNRLAATQWNGKVNIWSIQSPEDVDYVADGALRFVQRSEKALQSIQTALENDSNLQWSRAARGQVLAAEGRQAEAKQDYLLAKTHLADGAPCLLFHGNAQVIAPGIDAQEHPRTTLEAWVSNWDHGVVAMQIAGSLLQFDSPEFYVASAYKFNTSLKLDFGGKLPKDPKEWTHVACCETPDSVRFYVDGNPVRTIPNHRRYKDRGPLHIAGNAMNAKLYQGQGLMRAFRVSTRDLYDDDFKPPETFEADEDTFLLYDFTLDDTDSGTRIIDRSGNGRHGQLRDAWWIAEKKR